MSPMDCTHLFPWHFLVPQREVPELLPPSPLSDSPGVAVAPNHSHFIRVLPVTGSTIRRSICFFLLLLLLHFHVLFLHTVSGLFVQHKVFRLLALEEEIGLGTVHRVPLESLVNILIEQTPSFLCWNSTSSFHSQYVHSTLVGGVSTFSLIQSYVRLFRVCSRTLLLSFWILGMFGFSFSLGSLSTVNH